MVPKPVGRSIGESAMVQPLREPQKLALRLPLRPPPPLAGPGSAAPAWLSLSLLPPAFTTHAEALGCVPPSGCVGPSGFGERTHTTSKGGTKSWQTEIDRFTRFDTAQ